MSVKTQRPAWTKGTVDVAVREVGDTDNPVVSRQPCRADIWGLFAVHEAVSQWEWGWTVTHVPSGYALLASARTSRSAKAFCVEVTDLIDWSKLTTENARQMIQDVKPQLIEAAKRARP